MPWTKSDICNMALSNLGLANNITNIDEPEAQTEKIFAHLTGGKYTKAIVSKDLAITPAENGEPSLLEWQYLSIIS